LPPDSRKKKKGDQKKNKKKKQGNVCGQSGRPSAVGAGGAGKEKEKCARKGEGKFEKKKFAKRKVKEGADRGKRGKWWTKTPAVKKRIHLRYKRAKKEKRGVGGGRRESKKRNEQQRRGGGEGSLAGC